MADTDPDALFDRAPVVLAPGAVLLPGHHAPGQQNDLLRACRSWARAPAGLRTVRTGRGVMSVRQVGLGWHWSPRSGYTRRAVDGDGATVKPFPSWLRDLAREAVAAAYRIEPAVADGTTAPADGVPAPDFDIGLVNHYPAGARMGMHQDADERAPDPVVSFSLGDACVFRLGHRASGARPWRDVELRSGDAMVFGGPSRLAFHGVPRTHPGTAPPWLGLTGRINVTVRVFGAR